MKVLISLCFVIVAGCAHVPACKAPVPVQPEELEIGYSEKPLEVDPYPGSWLRGPVQL